MGAPGAECQRHETSSGPHVLTLLPPQASVFPALVCTVEMLGSFSDPFCQEPSVDHITLPSTAQSLRASGPWGRTWGTYPGTCHPLSHALGTGVGLTCAVAPDLVCGQGSKLSFEKTPVDSSCVHDLWRDDFLFSHYPLHSSKLHSSTRHSLTSFSPPCSLLIKST